MSKSRISLITILQTIAEWIQSEGRYNYKSGIANFGITPCWLEGGVEYYGMNAIEIAPISFAQTQRLIKLIGANNTLYSKVLQRLNVTILYNIPKDKFEEIAKYIASETKVEE